MWRTWPRPAIESSISRVTWVSSSVGAAPGREALTTTSGRSTSGLSLIRMLVKPEIPARVSSTNSRMTGIGFLIAQREMLFIADPLALGRDGHGRRRRLARKARAMRTASPSPRKPAPSTTTRSPAFRPLADVRSALRARMSMRRNWGVVAASTTNTPGWFWR
jgi:hypothetical protein